MELIDVLIGLLLIYELFRGLKGGFMAEAASIIGLVIAFYAASAFQEKMAHLLSPVCFDSERWSAVIGFLFTFLVVYLLIVILAKIFEGFLGVIALGGVNRLAGGAFCLLKGALVLSIILNLYETIDSDRSFVGVKHIKSSVFYQPVLKMAPALFPSFRSEKLLQHPETTDSNDLHKMTV
ncbi:MAG: CvpA family protein [Bacteroidales bacterium]|nr:CvpA family protein [Bacteroidales bacterium]